MKLASRLLALLLPIAVFALAVTVFGARSGSPDPGQSPVMMWADPTTSPTVSAPATAAPTMQAPERTDSTPTTSTEATSGVTRFHRIRGTGFVRSSDVLRAFGWGDANLQAGATVVTFQYHTTYDGSAVCRPANGSANHSRVRTTIVVIRAVKSDIVYGPNKEVAGFALLGLEAPQIRDNTPTAACADPNGDNVGSWVRELGGGPETQRDSLYVHRPGLGGHQIPVP